MRFYGVELIHYPCHFDFLKARGQFSFIAVCFVASRRRTIAGARDIPMSRRPLLIGWGRGEREASRVMWKTTPKLWITQT